jgi:hypothetical protein
LKAAPGKDDADWKIECAHLAARIRSPSQICFSYKMHAFFRQMDASCMFTSLRLHRIHFANHLSAMAGLHAKNNFRPMDDTIRAS